LDYLYVTYNAPVNFGGGLVTSRTPVDLELFAWPTTLQSLQNYGFSFQNFFASDGAVGVLGVGPNAGGPGPSIPTQALPGALGQGVLINEDTTSPYLQFGGPPTNVGTPIAVLNGSPITNLNVNVNGTNHTGVPSIVDSGGVDGTILSSLNATPGELITVTDPTTGHTLYSFTYNGDYFPTPISGGLMNTGNLIYQQHPVYISYGAETSTIFPT
jgi:hypothetical protein